MPPVTNDTLFRYLCLVYDKLDETAVPAQGYDKLWEGKIIETFGTLGISNAHYSRVMDTAKELGYIEQVQRGARGTPTQYALHRRPELADLEGANLTPHLTKPSESAKLSHRLSIVEGRLQGIDIQKMFADHERRLRDVERKVK